MRDTEATANKSTRMPREPLIAHPGFFHVSVCLMVLGNAIDLMGTYISQPHFEDEANWVYVWLTSSGLRPGWTAVIAGKVLTTVTYCLAMRCFLVLRRSFYPASAGTLRDFMSLYLCGRVLTWVECTYRPPRVRPTLTLLCGVAGLTGPYYMYLGYVNLAAKYGWWCAPWVRFGGLWFDSSTVLYVLATTAWLVYQMWVDFKSLDTARATNGDCAGSRRNA